MKRTLYAGVSILALMVGTNAAMAAPTIFSFTGGFQTYTAPTTGSYTIVAFGAQGGASNGGDGAEIGGILSLTAGEMLRIAVGGQGGSYGRGGGGGGGSFVVAPGVTPLVIAGGGGGGAFYGPAGVGLTGTSGGNSNPAGAPGGMSGLGGAGGTASYGGGGGGGFRGNGGGGQHPPGGNGYPAGLGANYFGGFGGGGPTSNDVQPAGGGGGGYSGGAGGSGYGGPELERQTHRVLEAFADRPHVFNLGHGIGQFTPVAHVEQLVGLVRGWKR